VKEVNSWGDNADFYVRVLPALNKVWLRDLLETVLWMYLDLIETLIVFINMLNSISLRCVYRFV